MRIPSQTFAFLSQKFLAPQAIDRCGRGRGRRGVILRASCKRGEGIDDLDSHCFGIYDMKAAGLRG